MNKISFYRWSYLSFLGLLSTIILEILTSSRYAAFAQSNIIPDDTLGKENSIVVPLDSAGFSIDAISGGATRGINLFHSFKEFNVGEGRSSYFLNNDNNLQNILTRVTGNNPSNILGTLGISNLTGITSNPNLYLINPNGIVFGENASLDVSDSFVATTADGIQFGEQGFFSATNLEQSSLLSVAPGALFFQQVRSQPGNIINRGNLAVGKDFTVAADNLDLQGQLLAGGNLKLQGTDKVKVRDSLTNPFIAAAKGELLVQGNQSVDIFALKHPDSGFFSGGDMVLRSANQVGGDAKYWSGGSFRIEQLDGSLGDLFSPYDPVIRSLGDVSFNNYLGASLHILAGGSVTVPGSIFITSSETGASGENFIAENIALSNETILPIDGSLKPTLDIRAGVDSTQVGVSKIPANNFPKNLFFSEFVELSGFTFPLPENPVTSNTATTADIKIGTVGMLTDNAANGIVFLTNQYKPNTALSGGNIEVRTIRTDDRNGQFLGNGGSVVLDSRSDITVNGLINSSSRSGNSGNITMLAGKDINIIGRDVTQRDNFGLQADVSGTGNSGNIFLQANDAVLIKSAAITSNVTEEGFGEGSNININSNSLSMRDGAFIAASTFGQGNAGGVFLKADESINLDARSFIANSIGSTRTGAVGNSAGITIEAGSLNLTNGAVINANGNANGSGEVYVGDISIKTIGNVSLTGDETEIKSDIIAGNPGKSGNIDLQAGSLVMSDRAAIGTSTFGEGNAGRVSIKVDGSIQLNRGEIFNTVRKGATGNSEGIEIQGQSLSLKENAFINSGTSGEGNAGEIFIAVDDFINIENGSSILSLISGRSENNKIRSTGGINIDAKSISLSNKGIIGATAPRQGNSGDILIKAKDTISLNNGSLITNSVEPDILNRNDYDALGNSGDVNIEARSLSLNGNSQVNTTIIGQGNAGSIYIKADDFVSLTGIINPFVRDFTTSISSQVSIGGIGTSGDITIDTNSLFLSGAIITASTFGDGNSGKVTVQAEDLVSLIDASSIITSVDFGVEGSSGGIGITTGSLLVKDGSQVQAIVRGATDRLPSGQGNAGNITIDARDDITVTGIFTDSGEVLESSITNSIDKGAKGIAGEINIKAGGTLEISENAIVSSALDPGAIGEAGDINIQTQRLLIRNGGRISVATSGQGNAGDIFVQAEDSISLIGNSNFFPTGIFSSVGEPELANGGQIRNGGVIDIRTSSLKLDDSVIGAFSLGQGNPGNISINVDGVLRAKDSNITTTARQSSGGAINITAQDIRLFGDSDIRTNIFNGEGGGGNINLTANTIVALDDSDILSFARDGKGGDITFNTEGFFSKPLYRPNSPTANATELQALDNNSRVDVNASGTVNGAVTGLPDVTFIDEELTDLPDSQIDTNTLIANSCIARGNKRQENSFTITGSGGLRNSPGDGFVSTYSTGNVRNVSEDNQSSGWKKGEPIIEPQGVYKLVSGELVLSRECS